MKWLINKIEDAFVFSLIPILYELFMEYMGIEV
jgi:hypothetical protein